MDIGKPQRVYIVEPVEDPVPREAPAHEEEPGSDPVRVGEPDRELVPA